jgi:cell division protein FtsB
VNPAFYGETDGRRSSGVWTILNRLLITAIILAVCAGGAVAFIPLIKERSVTTNRIEALQAEIAREEALRSRNLREVEMLKNNPEYVEMIARDRLNMMKPGEVIIRLEAAPSPARPSAPAEAAPKG